MKAGSPPIRIGILSRWAELGQAYRQAFHRRVPDSNAVQRLIAAARPKLEADAQELKSPLELVMAASGRN